MLPIYEELKIPIYRRPVPPVVGLTPHVVCDSVTFYLAAHINVAKTDFVPGYRCSQCNTRFYGNDIGDLEHGCTDPDNLRSQS